MPSRAVLLSLVLSATILSATRPALAADHAVARGKYLVENVGMCSDCHTPRDDKGALLTAKALQGAPLGLKPVAPMPFADYAPKIAGIPAQFTEAQLVTFLQTGLRPDGSPARPPMPPYRLTRADARAVAAYLKSVK